MNFENIEDEQYFAELLEVIGGLEATLGTGIRLNENTIRINYC